MLRDNRKFRRGTGCYTCRSCGKKTRETGSSESFAELCLTCFDYFSWENTHNDESHAETPDPDCPICNGTMKEPCKK